MQGISEKLATFIEDLVDKKFDRISLDLLGLIPNFKNKKRIIFNAGDSSLLSLFLDALGSSPNKDEEKVLKMSLRIANGYIEALRDRTKARMVQKVDSYIKDQKQNNKRLNTKKIKGLMDKEFKSAKNHFKLIANTESNKVANTGTALQISKIGEEKGEEPTVFFVVTHDDVTGDEEYRLHTLPDKITPRVWKLSEIGNEYHKKGDPNPKLAGLHPNCRCKITYLAKGFGFNQDGKVAFKGLDWDEYEYQKDNFDKPKKLN